MIGMGGDNLCIKVKMDLEKLLTRVVYISIRNGNREAFSCGL